MAQPTIPPQESSHPLVESMHYYLDVVSSVDVSLYREAIEVLTPDVTGFAARTDFTLDLIESTLSESPNPSKLLRVMMAGVRRKAVINQGDQMVTGDIPTTAFGDLTAHMLDAAERIGHRFQPRNNMSRALGKLYCKIAYETGAPITIDRAAQAVLHLGDSKQHEALLSYADLRDEY